VDLRQLRYFVAVAEDLNFTAASRRLHVSQPTVSVQVAKLERELGVELIERSDHRLRLSPAGVALLTGAARLVGALDELVGEVRQIGRGQRGRLKIGFVPAASSGVLVELLREFSESHPDVELVLRERQPDELVRDLGDRSLDICFLYMPVHAPGLRTHVVSSEPLVAAVPSTHPLSDRSGIELRALAGERFLLPTRYVMSGLRSRIIAACGRAGFEPQQVGVEVWLLQTIVGLVAAGVGVALIPASLQHAHRDGVAYLPIAGAPADVKLGMVWLAGGDSELQRGFRDSVLASG
jgi:DNA-binding transcriptional LysR family regulator